MIRPKNIVIVDDDPRMRDLMSRELRAEGFCMLEAPDGESALQLMRRHRRIDLVLLDLLIPQTSGLDIFDSIRKDFPEVPIIITSVYSKEEQAFLIWNADGYYYKSEGISELLKLVHKMFAIMA